MEGKKLAGLALAATAAALFMTGCASMGDGGTSAKVHCEGANACKGMSDCKTRTVPAMDRTPARDRVSFRLRRRNARRSPAGRKLG